MRRKSDTVFFDDFSNGIWTKYVGNPVMVRTQLWAESDYICEPNLLYKDGLFHNWFAQMYPVGGQRTALGYATSHDGFTWTKYPQNPVLAEGEVHRPYVMEHQGIYFLYAVQNENVSDSATMRRWSSQDGINWSDERLVMTCSQGWEGGLSNMAVIVDDDGTWRMLYTGADAPPAPQFGYAFSPDGVRWTKHEGNPVIDGFYGGDPFLTKIGDRYYTWHSEGMAGSLRISCRWSADMICWHPVANNPQINYTQPWERGIPPDEGGTTAGHYGHLTDATLCETQGKVFMIYQGAQTPLGVATFHGTLAQLADRLHDPPLSAWKESPFGMVDGGMLKLADNGSDRAPLVAEIPEVRDRYALESRIQCYAGATHRVSVVMRYGDPNTFARFWLHDADHTFYQECVNGLMSSPANIGPNPACNAGWHDWTVKVCGNTNHLSIDGQDIGTIRTSDALLRKLSQWPAHIGFGTHETYAAVDYVRVVPLNT
ncbi:MAG: hypothetical protein V1800_12400 [Candidatus Latescibacterota bacterium]